MPAGAGVFCWRFNFVEWVSVPGLSLHPPLLLLLQLFPPRARARERERKDEIFEHSRSVLARGAGLGLGWRGREGGREGGNSFITSSERQWQADRPSFLARSLAACREEQGRAGGGRGRGAH
ncbi:hypothetical protein MPTK1_7g14720 [Marchantia polymorpha subsp. ruderalis]|uniref:Uncharacterized protein n=2 Tax=Marchantia polymorpha TaxID=3197 RepID=A0AAF6BZM9_MARPO|nr:hypothetical protein MARPO_0009s0157 [Marchantia polymorpha]BBN17463.1 hypothetical protein Mp_7g14720 [Marchantia polymorpha subsp. ruderalis]|eukprot:PTQ47069.1 hypothetical protein MARPO_0009s0157 [Marchantia polymorpha]